MEARLQAMIEGGVARIFPSSQANHNLAQRLTEAMHAGLRTGPGGAPLAPNLYLLRVHPALAPGIEANTTLLDGLSQALREAGAEAGFRFNTAPTVRVTPDESVEPGDVQVTARNSLEELRQTRSFEIPPLEQTQPPPSTNAFLIVDGTHIYPLTQTTINIGRRADNHLVVDDPRVSRSHAQLRLVRGRYVIFDLDSTGGTLVNGELVHQHTLRPGDVISLAGVPLVFGQDGPAPDDTQDWEPAGGETAEL